MSSVECLREFVNERLTAAAEEIFGVFKQTIVEYEEEIDRQRRLLDIVWKPEIKLHRIDVPQQHVCVEEEVLPDQQLCIQERNSSLDQEDPEPLQIKDEQELCTSQEGEQLVLKQETDTFMLTPTDEEIDHQFLSPNSQVAESQDEKGGEHGDSGSTRDAEPEQKNQHHESRSDSINGYDSTMSEIHCNTHTIEKSLKCDTCGKDFKYKSFLQRHMRIHTGEKPCLCKTCRKSFCDISALNRHMTIHTGEKAHTCQTCERAFRHSTELIVHMKKAHTAERPYLCTTCGKRFINISTLKRHMMIHTGEKPYLCKTCGKRFNDISALKRHKAIHTGERPYTCNTCGRAFRRKAHLTVHIRRAHTAEKP